MSYRGKPSKSCEKCRSRKVKCDEGKPACARCQKSGQPCKYRDEHDLFFRDQSTETERKAQKKWRSRATKVSTLERHGNIDLSQQLVHQDPPTTIAIQSQTCASSLNLPFINGSLPHRFSSLLASLPPYLDISKNDVAIGLFFKDYVLPGSETNADEGYLDFLPEMYAKASNSSCLKWAVSAVAMAHVGNTQRLPNVKQDAAHDYHKALKLSMSALVNEEASRMTETLIAVYLLIFYENITCTQAGNSTWSTHVAGAVTIVTLRGESQFKSVLGMKIFRIVHTHMLVAAICQRKHPSIPLQMWTDHYKSSPTTACLMTLIYRTAALRAEAFAELSPQYRALPPKEKVEGILSRALKIEEGYQTWSDIAPSKYKYQAVPRSNYNYGEGNPLQAEGAPKTVHIYSNCRVSAHWNLFRATRIFLTQTIVSCVKQLNEYPSSPPNSPPRSTTNLDTILKKTIRCSFESADSICASVDTALSAGTPLWSPDTGLSKTEMPQNTGNKDQGHAGALRGYTLVFPLWVSLLAYEATMFSPLAAKVFAAGFNGQEAEGIKTGFDGSMMEIAYKRCEWIKGVLLHIHSKLGISQAGAIGRKSMQEGRQLAWRW